MQKTKIEWCDYSWNPVKGLCPTGCWYCYARAMYKRFKWNPKLRFDPIEATSKLPKKPSRIFVASTIDLFHQQIPSKWIQWPISVAEMKPQHTFIFLTKFPERYAEFDFPDNCWLGVTITRDWEVWKFESLKKKDNIRFISFEPLLDSVSIPVNRVDWIIVGAMTGAQSKPYQPKSSWIHTIVQTCRALNIPLFLKPNLKSVWGKDLIQEHPKNP